MQLGHYYWDTTVNIYKTMQLGHHDWDNTVV